MSEQRDTDHYDVVIVGAGLSGIGAAYRIRQRNPEVRYLILERRSRIGKFYYQPPSGESWADVVLRVRSLLADLRHGFADADVWVFTHQAVIMSFRYVLEGLTEQQLLEIDRTETIENVSMTVYTRTDDGL